MRTACVVPVLLLALARLSTAGEARLALPLTIPGVRTPVTVAAGDINGDGRLDLVAASGGPQVTVLLQDRGDRTSWEPSILQVGSSVFFVRIVDLDGDGYAEVLVGDTARTAFVVPNAAGVLGKPLALTQARTSRWVTAADLDGDGALDAATADFAVGAVSVFTGATPDLLRFFRTYAIAEPHAVEGSDHDGDGDFDLLVGHGDHGLRTLKNGGPGIFAIQGLVGGFVPCARYVYAADFNGDGKGDAATTCLRFGADGNIVGTVLAGTSNGDNSFAKTLEVPTADIATLAIADLNADGHRDLARVSVDGAILTIHLGRGDGTFGPPDEFGVTGQSPAYLAAADLDGDGRSDVIAASTAGSTLTVFWGQEGAQILAGGHAISGSHGSPAAVADLDGDGYRDICLTRPTPPSVEVSFHGRRDARTDTGLSIPTPVEYGGLVVLDLDGDAVPDLLGSDARSGTLRSSFLGAGGAVRKELAWPVTDPGNVIAFAAAPLDADALPDVIVAPRLDASDVAVYLNRGESFLAGPTVATIPDRRLIRLADADGDAITDVLAAATGVAGVCLGRGDGTFGELVTFFRGEPPRSIGDLLVAELSGDAYLDVAVAIPGRPELALVRGRGERAFEPPLFLPAPPGTRSLSLVDWNGDSVLDLASNSSAAAAIFLRTGSAEFAAAEVLMRPPGGVVDHLIEDLGGDGALDLTLFGTTRAYVFTGHAGEPAAFRRGDADGSGAVELTDAVQLLEYLFRGGAAPCEDASDADDDGLLNLTDVLVPLRWLFQGGPAPASPGPLDCGEDATADELAGCEAVCR